MRVKHNNNIIILSLITTTLSLLSASSVSALTYQDGIDMQFTFNPTVSINVSGDLIIPDLAPGSSSDSNIITITAGSNDAHGYKLYGTVGSSSSNYTDLRLSSSNTTNVFTNLSSNKANLTNFSDNTWGYSYSTDSGSSWVSGSVGSTSSGYNGLPLYNSSNNTSGVILASTSSASETSLQFKIGAKAASTQVSGTYTNTINFIGVGNVVTTTYSLNYVDASGEGTGLPASLSGQTTNDGVITLSDTAPTRTDYVFKGWCDTNNSSDPTTCSGTTYNPGRIYIIPAASQGGTVTVNMYAIWGSSSDAIACNPSGTTITTILCMQDVSTSNVASIKSSMTQGQQYQLMDSRDNKVYYVAKLTDGNIWMTQNLDHDIVTDGSVTYDSTTTDVASTWAPSSATKVTSDTSWTSSSTAPYSYDPGDLCWSGTYSSTNLASLSSCDQDGNHYHIGNYYNWSAAVASNDTSAYGASSYGYPNLPDTSICPAGWGLPRAGTGSDTFFGLTNGNYSTGTALSADPAYFVPSGYWSGSASFVGSQGHYWSAVSYSFSDAYRLFFHSSSVSSSGDDGRNYGHAVRCMARPLTTSLTGAGGCEGTACK